MVSGQKTGCSAARRRHLLILHTLKGFPKNGLYAPVALLYLDRLRRTLTPSQIGNGQMIDPRAKEAKERNTYATR